MVTENRKQLKRLFSGLLLSLVALLLAGCALPTIGGPKFISHPRPEMTVDLEPFRNAGCAPDDYQRWHCPADSPIAGLGCDHLAEPPDLLGGLDPAYPLMECHLTPFRREGVDDPTVLVITIDEEGFFFMDGCMLPDFIRYVVYQDGEFRLFRSEADMRLSFGPVTSPEEALSWAIASTGFSPYFDVQPIEGYRYLVDEMEGTHVTETEDGYRVNLFYYQFCGCGPHTTSQIDVQVSQDGHTSVGETTPVFENPEEDDLCVD